MIVTKHNIKYTDTNNTPIIEAVQGDTGRTLLFVLGDYRLTEGTTARYYIMKPSGESVYNDATVEVSTNTITVELTAQSLAEIGDAHLQVRLTKDEETITSFEAVLRVVAFRGIGAVESSTEANIFDQQVEEAFDEIDTHKADALEEIDTEIDTHVANGKFPNMAAGDIISDLYAENKTPYFFRTSGGGSEVGTIEAPVLVGGSVAWNQLVQNGNFADGKTNWYGSHTGSVTGGFLSVNITGAWNNDARQDIDTISGHVYFGALACKTSSSNQFTLSFGQFNTSQDTYFLRTGTVTSTKTRYEGISKATASGASVRVELGMSGASFVGDTFEITDVQLIDLTLLLGSTIADRLYTLEQSTAGSGIAQLRAWGFDFGEYIPYSAPTLKHVEGVSAHKMVGFNQWDEEWRIGAYNTTGVFVTGYNFVCSKNPIKVIPGATYYFNASVMLWTYDSDMNYVSSLTANNSTRTMPENVRFLNFRTTAQQTTYNHDICINISNSAKNGQYEPYRTWSYALDSTLTLRGVPKLDANNSLYYDGDTYEPDGTLTRNCAVRAYQSGDESLADAITDGTNTVYKLSTPTTETAEPYTEYQEVDASGTEEYISTGVVPVGHTTKYPTDLKGTFESILSAIPSGNGTYALKVTVNNGKKTFSWV